MSCPATAGFLWRSMGIQEQLLKGYRRPSEATCHLARIDPLVHETRYALYRLKGFPFLREERGTIANKMPHIEISAPTMRVGKTTAEEALEEYMGKRNIPAHFSWEEWWNNPHLKDSYNGNDPVLRSKAILFSQLWFLRNKFRQISSPNGSKVFVQEVSPDMDGVYAMANLFEGKLLPQHYEEYRREFESLNWSKAPRPDLLIYLTVSEEGMLSRVQASLRDFEKKDYDPDYYRRMKVLNDLWVAEAKRLGWNVLEVDTDELNLATDGNAREKFGGMVVSSLKERGYLLEIAA